MNAPELVAERRRRYAVADLPARGVVGLAERADHEAARKQIRVAHPALMAQAVEDDVLIDLVRKQIDVPVGNDVAQRSHVVGTPDRSGGVVRGVGDDEPRSVAHQVPHPPPIHPIGGRVHGHVQRAPALQAHHRLVAVVGRIEDDHLIARVHHRRDGAEQRLGCPRCHRHFPVRIDPGAVKRRHLVRDRRAQRGNPHHGRVLVVAAMQIVRYPVEQGRRTVKIRESLGQIQRPFRAGELRHHREDGRSHIGQLARQRRGNHGGKHCDQTQLQCQYQNILMDFGIPASIPPPEIHRAPCRQLTQPNPAGRTASQT